MSAAQTQSTSWLDKLASTPLVGFKFDPLVSSGDSLIDALAPVLSKYIAGDTLHFNVESVSPLGISFNTDIGLRFTIDQSRLTVGYNHRIRAVLTSGGPPELEMLSQPRPFTTLLPDILETLVDTASLLPGIKHRKVQRIGIVANTAISEEDLPPGIARFVKYIGKPWTSKPEQFQITLTAVVNSGSGWYDHCVHSIAKPDTPGELVQMSFDWGRNFDPGQPSSRQNLGDLVSTARKAAIAYLEELAEGNRFDENLSIDGAATA